MCTDSSSSSSARTRWGEANAPPFPAQHKTPVACLPAAQPRPPRSAMQSTTTNQKINHIGLRSPLHPLFVLSSSVLLRFSLEGVCGMQQTRAGRQPVKPVTLRRRLLCKYTPESPGAHLPPRRRGGGCLGFYLGASTPGACVKNTSFRASKASTCERTETREQ